MTTFRSLKVNAFVLPTSYSLCGTIFEPAWFCCSEPKYSPQMLDSTLLILKSSKLCFDAKKVFRPLGQILTFFVLNKNVFCTASTSLQRNLHFVASSHNFLTFLKKCCFERLFNIFQNCSKTLLLRQKSVPPAWLDSYIFCFD